MDGGGGASLPCFTCFVSVRAAVFSLHNYETSAVRVQDENVVYPGDWFKLIVVLENTPDNLFYLEKLQKPRQL